MIAILMLALACAIFVLLNAPRSFCKMVLRVGSGLAVALISPGIAMAMSSGCALVNSQSASINRNYVAIQNTSTSETVGSVSGSAGPSIFEVGETLYYSYTGDNGSIPSVQTRIVGAGAISDIFPRALLPNGTGGLVTSSYTFNGTEKGLRFLNAVDTAGGENVTYGSTVTFSGVSCVAVGAPMPTIVGVNPTSGSTAGGAAVTITGTNFSAILNNNIVQFGSNAATVTAASSTELTVTTPAGNVGAVNVSVEVGGQTATANNAYTYVDPPIANNVSATVAANSSANPITLNVTGGAATSVAVGTQASHGTASASGTTITYTPTAGYSGPDSFTYTATNVAGTSSAATVTVTVSAPTLGLSPTPGSLPDPTVGVAYSQTLSANGGTGPYSYLVTSGPLPAGLTLSTAGVLSGTPTAGGSFPITVKATDAYGATGTQNYTLTVAAPALSISPATLPDGAAGILYATQAFTGSGGTAPYTFQFTPMLPDGLDFATNGQVTGTPTTQGHYTFTVTVTDSSTGSGPYSTQIAGDISINPSPSVVLTPADGSTLTAGQVGVTYSDTSISATGGAGTIDYSVDAATPLPVGLSINATTGAITGTPTAAGSYTFTVWAAGTMGGAEYAEYTIVIASVAPTISVSASDSTPALGAPVTFTAALTGGASPTGTVTFKDGAATLGTGTISGTTATFSTTALTAGPHSITAEYGGDANNAAVTSAPVTVTVSAPLTSFTFTPASGNLTDAMVGEEYRQQIKTTGGASPLTYRVSAGALPPGMSFGGPADELTGMPDTGSEGDYAFTIEVRDNTGATATANYTLSVKPRAVTVTDKTIKVTPGSAPANVNLADQATGGPFTDAGLTFVEPPNAGTVSIVRGEFAAAGPTPLGWYLKFIPDPAYSGTVKVGFKLTSALGISNNGVVTYTIGYDPQKVANDIDSLVHGFVETRQSLIASSIKVPGLMERRQLQNATDPVTARLTPSEEGMTASFSTSLAQMEAARNSADGVEGAASSPFNIWIDGTVMAHRRDQNDGKWGSFAMLNLGADYLVSDKALVGISFHLDRMSDPTKADAELTGNGWLAGPYASFEIGKGVFWDTSLLYGGSSNDIDTTFWDGSFETERWMIDTALKGEWQIDEATVLTPMLRAVYFNETVEDYTVRNAAGDALTIDGFDAEQFRVSLGAEIARSFTLENGATVTPKLGVTAGYSGLDGSGAYAALSAGVSVETVELWMLEASLLLNVEGDGQKSLGGRVRAARQF